MAPPPPLGPPGRGRVGAGHAGSPRRAPSDAGPGTSTSCDTLVVLGASTRSGATLFAKNSDRPPTECQALCWVPPAVHPPGSRVRCQYLEIPQAPATLGVLGSRPWWLWGFEHGVNERGVAIGNEALHTREQPAEVGLLGMDLVRLGLERGRTAAEARDVITDHAARYGQGGSAAYGGSRRYHNSFIVADPEAAWVLETSGRHWVARRVRDRAAISNLATIGDDWDEASPGIETDAAARGWWTPAAGRRLDFRAAFENPEPRYRAEARYEASCRFLAAPGRVAVSDLMRHLRDHHDGGTVHRGGRKDGDPLGWSVCMHPDPGAGATAAGLVAELPREPGRPVVAWCAMTTPCTSPFVPIAVPLAAPLPAPLTTGTGEPDPASLWWRLKALGDAVMLDPAARTPVVQGAWQAWERGWLAAAAQDPRAAAAGATEAVDALLRQRDALLARLTPTP
jgi:secernin